MIPKTLCKYLNQPTFLNGGSSHYVDRWSNPRNYLQRIDNEQKRKKTEKKGYN